jgi:hypothetical protein
MEKLTTLSKEQQDALSNWTQKWIEIGYTTEPANWAMAEAAITEEYALAGLDVPTYYHVFSPSAGVSLIRNVLRQTRIPSYIGGQIWASWPARTSFFRVVCGLDIPDIRERVSQSCGMYFPLKNACVIVDRFSVVVRDEQGHLHCATGPALAWRDGSSAYYWHGIKIPAEWIESPQNLNPQVALTWPQIEQRRAAAEILGWGRILMSFPHQVIDKDSDPAVGTLLEVDLPDAPGARFLRVQCGTGRDFVLPVPETIATALEANAWTWGADGVDPKIIRTLGIRT